MGLLMIVNDVMERLNISDQSMGYLYPEDNVCQEEEKGVQNKGNWDIPLFLNAKIMARKQYKAIISLHPLFLNNGFLSSIMNA